MKTTHTKGEWILGKNVYGEPLIYSQKERRLICKILLGNKNEDEILSNIKLIRAAPDLLKALIRFQKEYIINPKPSDTKNNISIELEIDNAIKKAIL